MSKTRKKKVEWKETNNFIFTPKYEYSLPVRNRYVFFWCMGNQYKKMLNYVENFASPYAICCVYIFGDLLGKQETFEKFLSQKRGNILVLYLPDIQQEIDTAERFSAWLETLKTQGMRKILDPGKKKSQYSMVTVGRTYADEPSDEWIEQYEKLKRADMGGYLDVDGRKWLDRLQVEFDLWTVEYPAAVEKIQAALESGYKAYGVASSVVAGSEADHNNALMKIARSIYPSGIETDTDRDFCYKMAAIKRMSQSGIKGESVESLGIKLSERIGYQFNLFEDVTRGATEAATVLTEWCERQIRTRGCFSIGEAWLMFSRPPFGAYRCNWYIWIFAYALRGYASKKYFYADVSGISSQRVEPDGFFNAVLYGGGKVFIQNEDQNEFMRLLMKMFDIEKPWRETTRSVLTQAISWITDSIHYVPLSALDPKWGEIFRDRHNSYWNAFGYEKEYLPWLRNNFDYFYTEIRQLDTKLHDRLAREYGQLRADLYFKYSYVKGGAIGWLHSADDLEERIAKYMSYKNVCRECGNTIVPEGLKIREYETHVKIDDTDVYGKYEKLIFTEKDIIGLNKKLLGRYQNEYFCVRCLCDVLDTDEARLHETLEEFKEDGCQLFT